MSKIMVAMATYNGERYLGEMLDSLARQTRKPDKIFVADDASTDATVKILEAFAKLPMAIIKQERNSGFVANFSTAIEAALAECGDEDFIALADQDDIWLPEKLEILEREIGGADLVFGDAEVIDASGKKIADSWREFAKPEETLSVKERVQSRCNVGGCMTLCRASLMKKALPIPQPFAHDEWISLLATVDAGVKSVSQKVIRYRLHGKNTVGVSPALCMSKLLERNIRNAEVMLSERRLAFTAGDRQFLERYLKHLKKTRDGFLNPEEFPWIFKNRRVLFRKAGAFKTAGRVLFSCTGLRFAKIFFGKS